MSVLIKGMEMPKKGTVITIYKLNGNFYASVHGTELCLLVPVPPHGRLIDADDFCRGWDKKDHSAEYEHCSTLFAVDETPTIIEAEEVYGQYTDTAGNFHWYGTHSGEHIIKAEQAADVKPVVRGHNAAKDYAACDQFRCSECGVELQGWYRVERGEDSEDRYEFVFSFCPNCGADMRGDDGDV